MQWEPKDEDKNAAWELYVEVDHPCDDTATRPRRTRIAVVVLNQKVRPLTAKWHPIRVEGKLSDSDKTQLRAELHRLQMDLRNYTRLLADLADVEDLTDLETV